MPNPSLDPLPDDYPTARSDFLRAADLAGARVGSHPLSIRSPKGLELSVDTARLGPEEPEALVVVSAGTHGVEGCAGSALQRELQGAWRDLELPPQLGLLLVHAVNPWGFATGRRVNERNVDLNRNFLAHPAEHEPQPDYEGLHPHLNPETLDEEHDRRAREALRGFAQQHGIGRLQEVLSVGQHQRPTGLQFGGTEPEESNRIVREIASRETVGARRIVWIDIHTGLGPWAVPELITELEPDDPVYHRGRRWYGDAFRSTRAGESVSAALCGVIETGLAEAVDPGAELTPFTAEFGTVPPDRVFWALRADNWLHHHGDRESERGQAIRRELLEVFRPTDPAWARAVLDAGLGIVRRACEGLTGDAASPGS